MIQIQELIQLTLFDDFVLAAGKTGLKREMESIVILEYESFQNNYEDFDEKDFVLTSLFFAKDDPKMIEEALLNLMRREVAGIAIKTVFYRELPEIVLKAAEQRGIPIFLFQNAYMEDLIISANELLKSKLQYLVLEEKVKMLLERRPMQRENETVAYEINPFFGKKLAAAYIRPKGSREGQTMAMNFNRLAYKRFQARGVQDYAYVKYRDGLFLIFTMEPEAADEKKRLEEILRRIELRLEQYNIGLSGERRGKEELYILLEQALVANRVSQLTKRTLVSYERMGSYQFIAPLLGQLVWQQEYQNNIEVLQKYDSAHSSDLLQTLEYYVECHGEISKTAEELFQHPNTIRYRLKKAGSLIKCEESDFYIYVTMMIRLYQLKNYTKI